VCICVCVCVLGDLCFMWHPMSTLLMTGLRYRLAHASTQNNRPKPKHTLTQTHMCKTTCPWPCLVCIHCNRGPTLNNQNKFLKCLKSQLYWVNLTKPAHQEHVRVIFHSKIKRKKQITLRK